MVPRGINQVISGGQGSVDGGDNGTPRDDPPSSSASASASSSGGQHASGPNNVATKVVIPILVALALMLFAAIVIYLIMRFRRSSRRRRQLSRGLLPTATVEKPQLFEVKLEAPPTVHSATSQWSHIKVCSLTLMPSSRVLILCYFLTAVIREVHTA